MKAKNALEHQEGIDPPNRSEVGESSLRQDLDAGLRFQHIMSMQTKHDLLQATTAVYAVIEELVASGQINLHRLDDRRKKLAEHEEQRLLDNVHVQVCDTEDKYQLTDLPRIDCDSRLPLCKAKCCSFNFPLSFQDLDEGVVRWRYYQPYMIRQQADGYCVHHCRETGGCSVYEKRPSVCRTYDCRNDKRIWKDFEYRIPADAPENEAPGPAGKAPTEETR